MRKLTLLSLLSIPVLTVAACGDSTTADMAAAADLTAPVADMAVAPDLTPAADLTPVAMPDMTPIPPDWTCVGHVVLSTPAKPSYTFSLKVYDYLSKSAVAMATVKVCAKTDAMCATPTSMGMTDANGLVTLTAASDKTGLGAYLDINAGSTYPEVLLYLFSPAPDMTFGGANTMFNAPIFAKSTFSLVANILGVTPDATKGNVAFAASDCKNNSAPGVTVAATGGGTTYYVMGSLPNKTATMTDGTGAGFITNIAPGTSTITATEGGKVYSSDDVVVRAGTISVANLLPTM